MKRRQRTLQSSASISDIGLHTGKPVTLTLRPAPCNHGLKFKHNSKVIDAHVSNVRSTERQTALGNAVGTIFTVEHILSALYGMDIDNALIELTAEEAPICDGSAAPFVKLIEQCGIREQNKTVITLKISENVQVQTTSGSILLALPSDGLRISCTYVDTKWNLTQFHSDIIKPSTYVEQIASARTFVNLEDVESLRKAGLIKGGSEENAIVIREGILPVGRQRCHPNELARHKILDLIGDLALLGMRLDAHIIAIRPGHGINADLTRKLASLIGKNAMTSRL